MTTAFVKQLLEKPAGLVNMVHKRNKTNFMNMFIKKFFIYHCFKYF